MKWINGKSQEDVSEMLNKHCVCSQKKSKMRFEYYDIRNIGGLLVLLFVLVFSSCTKTTNDTAAKGEIYRKNYRVRSGIAIGGIGAGSIELRKDGQFYNWSIFNNYPLGTGSDFKIKGFPNSFEEESLFFFVVRYQVGNEEPKLKLLQLNNSLNEGGLQSIAYYYPWLSAIEEIEYSAEFPYTHLTFRDSEMPFDIKLKAFSPFIPHDVKNSTLPGAYFDFTIEPKTKEPIDFTLITSLRNTVGYDEVNKSFTSNLSDMGGSKIVQMSCADMDTTMGSWGTLSLASSSKSTSWYLGWEHKHPYYEELVVNKQLRNVDDTQNRNKSIDGELLAYHPKDSKNQRCFSSLAWSGNTQEPSSLSNTFVLSWHFPNKYGGIQSNESWTHEEYDTGISTTKKTGHYYDNYFSNSNEVGEYLLIHRDSLSESTFRFYENFYSSDLPDFVLNQVNSQLNTFVSSSTLDKQGRFALREGLTPEKSWGPNGTLDVTMYASPMIIALFPELQKSTMRAHADVQTSDGVMSHGLGYDLDYSHNGTWGVFHRIDLVLNYTQMVLRDYFWTNDQAYLKELWPTIRKAIFYQLRETDKDGDLMPEMSGIMCSYDNFPMYGLSSYIQSQWLNTMLSVRVAAKILDDSQMVNLADSVLERGRPLMEEHLWNGKYFDLANDYKGTEGRDDGSLTDQLIGQWGAHQVGLGYIVDSLKVKEALSSILKMSYKKDFGLRNCTWPDYPDFYPVHESDLWVDQANTCWSGVELAFAGLLMYEGMYGQALDVIGTVDKRYRQNGLYWDHQEFGGHYLRPMSAWSILNGALGLGIRGGHYTFSPCIDKDDYQLFFAGSNGTALFKRTQRGTEIKVLSGYFEFNSISLPQKFINSQTGVVKFEEQIIPCTQSSIGESIVLHFDQALKVIENQIVVISN